MFYYFIKHFWIAYNIFYVALKNGNAFCVMVKYIFMFVALREHRVQEGKVVFPVSVSAQGDVVISVYHMRSHALQAKVWVFDVTHFLFKSVAEKKTIGEPEPFRLCRLFVLASC